MNGLTLPPWDVVSLRNGPGKNVSAEKDTAFAQVALERGYVTPQDVKSLAPDVLRHRILLSYEAEAEGKTTDDIIKTVLERIEVP